MACCGDIGRLARPMICDSIYADSWEEDLLDGSGTALPLDTKA
jgi:hypothetical protein